MSSPNLFRPLTLRGLTVAGRAWVSPMCQYSCRDSEPGFVTDWHLAHLMGFAMGGAPLVLTEATAVAGEGRISPWDAGLWEDQHVAGWHRIVRQLHQLGTPVGVQLSHAGRKASTYAPFHPRTGTVPVEDGGWPTVGPTPAAFGRLAAPDAMTASQVRGVVADFAQAARRAVACGFDAVEIHAAHGYLLAQFLSPLVNTREDEYGGSDERRSRLLLEVVDTVRGALPARIPLLVRLSATDWSPDAPGGVEGDLERTVALARRLEERGVDLLDISSGGNVPAPEVPVGPGYQVPFAARVRGAVDIPVAAVGLITSGAQAERVLERGVAAVVLLGRAALADPRWWHRAAHELGHELAWVPPYARVVDELVY